jgi:hypothetical protein
MITRHLVVVDLDAKWTPKRGLGWFGLHADSTIWRLARAVATSLLGSLEETTPDVLPIRRMPWNSAPPIFLSTDTL